MSKGPVSISVEMSGTKGTVSRGIPYELSILSVTLTLVVLKLLLNIFTFIVLVEAAGSQHEYLFHQLQPIYAHHQLYCALSLIFMTILSSINTMMLVCGRMHASFLDDSSLLTNYNWVNLIAVLIQLSLYLGFMYQLEYDYVVDIYEGALGFVVIFDILTPFFMYGLEWRVNSLRDQLADEDEPIEEIRVSSGKPSV